MAKALMRYVQVMLMTLHLSEVLVNPKGEFQSKSPFLGLPLPGQSINAALCTLKQVV